MSCGKIRFLGSLVSTPLQSLAVLLLLASVAPLREAHAGFNPFSSPKKDAIKIINQAATDAGASLGLFKAKWLQSVKEVKKSHPDVVEFKLVAKPGVETYMEQTSVFGYKAGVTYVFIDDALLQVIVTFAGDPSRDRFMKIQSKINDAFIAMPRPTGGDVISLSSKKSVEGGGSTFQLEHSVLRNTPAGPREQFALSKIATGK